jgi:outer membrane protein OmpA-like peptidoglycan-associated protein
MMYKNSHKVLAGLMAITLFKMQSASAAGNPVAAPLYQVTVVQSSAKAINYRNLKGSVEIEFKGTVLLPAAKGVALVKNRAGSTEIKAEFENLTAPSQFGSEYLTYVFWAISPEGRATNLGELIVDDGKSKLNATAQLQSMGLLVTAEPYFAVSQPSNVVILENAIKADNKEKIELVEAKYDLLPRGQYTKNIAATDMAPVKMDKKTPFAVYQARNAVRIAKAAGAETYAAEGFKDAERFLALSETKEGGKKGRAMTARQAVQSAEDSRMLAVKRQTEEGLAQDKQQAITDVNNANMAADAANQGQMKAESAQAKAEAAKGQSDTERAAALALATNAAATSADSMADAKSARAAAEKSQGQADAANAKVQKIEGEKGELRAQLLQQLNSVLQTRDSARGLIVNMSDVLFQTGSSELRPQVREKLSKIAGIVLSHPGLKLAVEGHTDSVGSKGTNQRLSEKRAQAARDYLVSQGVSRDSITSQGFGEGSPIESNDTAEGRQKNRRVEMVVSGAAIGTQ